MINTARNVIASVWHCRLNGSMKYITAVRAMSAQLLDAIINTCTHAKQNNSKVKNSKLQICTQVENAIHYIDSNTICFRCSSLDYFVVIFDYISTQHVDREQLQALTTIYLEY